MSITLVVAMFSGSLLTLLQSWSASSGVQLAITFLSSIGCYKSVSSLVFWAIDKVQFIRRLVLGRSYLEGMWSYTYLLNGKEHFGIWRIEQDSHTTRVKGFGLNDDFRTRSDVRSVSDLLEVNEAFEIVNTRSDSPHKDRKYYSKTTLIPDYKKRGLLKSAYRMRGETVIFGGPLSGNVHDDLLFEKHFDAETEEDVIAILKSRQVKT